MALAGGGVPHHHRQTKSDFVVPVASGNLVAIWTEGNTVDRPIKRSIVSKHHTFENTQESETEVTYSECPLSVDWHSKVSAEPTAHIFTVSSSLPVVSLVPSLFHDTEWTLRFRGDVSAHEVTQAREEK